MALGTTVCQCKTQAPETTVNPNPPVITPVDPEKPDLEKPDQEKPGDEDNKDKENPIPEKPDPEQPDDPEVDYDNLTAADLTDEQKVKIVENVTTALKDNIQKEIGRAGYINRIIAMDFEDNYITLLLDYNGGNGDTYGLYKYKMTSDMTYKNLITTYIQPETNNMAGETLVQFPTNSHDERAQDVLEKLVNDGIIECNLSLTPLLISTANNGKGGTTNDTLSCGVTNIYVYRIDEQKLLRRQLAVKSDGNTKDFLGAFLINGEYYATHLKTGFYEFEFSEYALYDRNGLENTTNAEQA